MNKKIYPVLLMIALAPLLTRADGDATGDRVEEALKHVNASLRLAIFGDH